jgi:CDP-diacylglycerol--serine O-phosphatidyltransferase
MLRYLIDPANAITAMGVLFSAVAIHLALSGHLPLAVGVALWAMLADQLDGIVAGRLRNRAPEKAKMGKSLDGFADIIYGTIFPAIFIIEANSASLTSAIISAALLLAGVIRLSYFHNFGLSDDGRFLGIPLSYDVPLLGVLLLMQAHLAENFVLTLNIAFLALAALHVAPIRIPSPNKIMYGIIVLFSAGVSAALIIQSS